MTTKTIIDSLKVFAAVLAVTAALFFGYSVTGYVADTFAVAIAADPECDGCDKDGGGGGFGGFFNEPFVVADRGEFSAIDGGGGGGGYVPPPPPPPAPLCTLDLTQQKITWTTQYAYQVVIAPLTNSPQVPGYTTTNGGPTQTKVHSEAEAYNSSAVKAELLTYGINLPAVQGNTGFAGDQVTMNRVCELVDGPGATAKTYGKEGYSSPSNNAVVKYANGAWTRISATAFNNHLRFTFTCEKLGTIQTYPLNGSYTFVPPLGYGTHTYKLTATGTGGTVMCEDTITITPPPEPPTCELSAYPYSITQGGSTTLSWMTTNASSITINNGVGSVTPVASGSKSVSPSSTTTYTATVTGPGGSVQCSKKVTVVPPPQGECTLDISKSADKSVVNAGEYIEYTVMFKNIGQKKCTGSGVMVTDTLDPLLEYKSETHSTNITAGYQSDPVYKASDRTVRFNAWDLDPAESGWFKIKVKAGTPSACSAVVSNYAQITSYEYNNFNSWVSTQPAVKVTVNKDCTPPPPPKTCKLTIEKSADNTTVAPGEYVEYTITFKNIGTKDCTGGGVHVTDVLDPLLTYTSETHSSNVTPGYNSDPVYKTATRTVHFNAATLTPGESGWVKIKAKAGEPNSCTVDIDNVAKITAYEYDNFTKFETSNNAPVVIEKDCSTPAPTCTLTADPYQIYTGGSADLSWTTTNATQASIDNGVGVVTPVAAGEKTVSPTANTTYTLTATGPGGEVQCSKKIKVIPPPGKCELEIEKSVDKSTVAPGEIVEYTLHFKNVGNKTCTGSGVKIIDTLDSGLTYKSETHSDNVTGGYLSDPVYKSSTHTMHWNAWDLAPGESGWVKFKAKIQTPTACVDTIPNKAKITAYELGWSYVVSNTVNVTVEKDCTVPAPVCSMSASPTSVALGDSAQLSWTSSHVTSVTIDQGIGSVALNSSKSVAPTTTTTYLGTFTGPGGTVTCSAEIGVYVVEEPTPACTLSVSASSIKSGESVFVSWTAQNVTTGFINGVGTTTPVFGGTAEVFPSQNTTYTGTFTGQYGTVTCAAPVTVASGPGGCQGNCGGGLNQPRVVMLQKPPEAPLAYVTLEQIPYTGFAAGKALTLAFWLSVGFLAAAATYFVMGRGGVHFVLGSSLTAVGFGKYNAYERDEEVAQSRRVPDTFKAEERRSDSAAYNGNGYVASTMAPAHTAVVPHVMPMPAAKPATDGIPDLADVVESRAHAAGVLMSPEAVQAALALSTDRGETLRIFGDILNKVVQTLPREDGWIMLTSDRFDELADTTPAPVTLATPNATPSVEEILSSVMPAPQYSAPTATQKNVEMPMDSADDQAVVMSLARSVLAGNREQAYATVRNLETSGANAASVMTIIATAFDQLYRARRHGLTTDLTIAGMDIKDEVLVRLVEIFTHGMDAAYTNAFTALKLAVAQAFEARG